MTERAPLRLRAAISRLWAAAHKDEGRAVSSETFTSLVAVCIELYGRSGMRHEVKTAQERRFFEWGIRDALRDIGAPWFDDKTTAEVAAAKLHTAFVAEQVQITYLCPLNRADKLPRCTFGNSEIGRFSVDELATIVRPLRIPKQHHSWSFDVAQFSMFHWLIVRETKPAEPLGKRVMPILYSDLREIDFVDAHEGAFSEAVERALFVLMLFAWEDVGGAPAEHEWQPFRVPWCYAVAEDPFSSPKRPPSPETLSWSFDVKDDGTEIELPEVWHDFDEDRISELPEFLSSTSTAVDQICPMQSTGGLALNPLVRHFMVRALQSSGIDEFIAHITLLEAALALEQDRGQSTQRLRARVETLLPSSSDGSRFKEFYDLRSDYLHGRRLRSRPTRVQLKEVRSLARRVVVRLMAMILAEGWVDRHAMLASLRPSRGS